MTATTPSAQPADPVYEDALNSLETAGGGMTRDKRAMFLDLAAERACVIWRTGCRDPLAWAEVETMLRSLAAAERGTWLTCPDDPDETDKEKQDSRTWRLLWQDLASAGTADEHAAAVAALIAWMRQQPDGGPRLPDFAVSQFERAAAACTAGYPERLPERPANAV